MQLRHLIHRVSRVEEGERTEVRRGVLRVDVEGLRGALLVDRRLSGVRVEALGPDTPARAGAVFDVLEPRAKEPGSGQDFPGLLGPMAIAGSGSTHVLAGTAVTVVDPLADPGAGAPVLELGGEASSATPYGGLWHVVVAPEPVDGLDDSAARNAARLASVRAATYLGGAGIGVAPDAVEDFETGGLGSAGAGGQLPRVAFIGQVLAHHRYIEPDEPILYGSSTRGFLPTMLHPNEWIDGAVVCAYRNLGVETYFHQNHPVILDLLRRHRRGELVFAGVVATASASLEEERQRNCAMAAHLAADVLEADGAVLTSYGGGAPHADMGQTASLCEAAGVRTTVLVAEMAGDRRAESANIFAYPEVDAAVVIGGSGTTWALRPVERVVAATAERADALASMTSLRAGSLSGATNQQGASRIRAVTY